MVTSDNKWDWDRFSQLIPVNVLIIMTSIPAPRYEMDEDTVFRRNTTSGELSIRSAYELFDKSSGQLNMKDPIWRIIWRWKGPEKVRHFLWLVAQDGLLTNEKKRRLRHFTDNHSCQGCQTEEETALHLSRDCPLASQVLVESDMEMAFSVQRMTWLIPNLSSSDTTRQGMKWGTMLGVALWCIWKSRNKICRTLIWNP
ncbi:hypothetical protein NC653_022113 [Populus alba x Populus x berolinensis]|uniref:Reverse transcriptase zinc-binding domain-containing protein n=1 Tax=Populus alba x Populus x berolinensis TaxID=444605 RepID=A0AAD6VU39_9ROSI|nr:hypothetical protein NC653_022113 [Populus alba x Populus x berolinensis]